MFWKENFSKYSFLFSLLADEIEEVRRKKKKTEVELKNTVEAVLTN